LSHLASIEKGGIGGFQQEWEHPWRLHGLHFWRPFFSHGGKKAPSGSADKTARLWDVSAVLPTGIDDPARTHKDQRWFVLDTTVRREKTANEL
jgi:hypothetical protein